MGQAESLGSWASSQSTRCKVTGDLERRALLRHRETAAAPDVKSKDNAVPTPLLARRRRRDPPSDRPYPQRDSFGHDNRARLWAFVPLVAVVGVADHGPLPREAEDPGERTLPLLRKDRDRFHPQPGQVVVALKGDRWEVGHGAHLLKALCPVGAGAAEWALLASVGGGESVEGASTDA